MAISPGWPSGTSWPASSRQRISVPGSDERTNLRGRDKVGGWFGPRLSQGTEQQTELETEKAAAGPRGIVMPTFLPYFDDKTGEVSFYNKNFMKPTAG